MTAKLVFLCALTVILAGLVVLLIVLHPAQLPALAETIVGALLSALGLGAHAVFREPTPAAAPRQSAQTTVHIPTMWSSQEQYTSIPTPPASPANPTT